MLGRTDSRARALAAPRRLRGRGGQPRRAPRVLAGRAVATSSPRWRSSSRRCAIEIPATRGSIYDRTGTVVLATSVVARPPRGVPRSSCTPAAARRGRRRSSSPMLGLEGDAAANLTTRMTSEREYVVLARDLDPAIVRPDPRLSRATAPTLSGLCSSPSRCASTRRPAAARTRRSPRTSSASSTARARASTASSSSTRTTSPARRASSPPSRTRPATPIPDTSTVIEPGLPGAGPHAHHRRGAPGRGRAGAPRGVDRRPREAGVRGRDGPVHRRGLSRTRATRRTTPTTTRRSRPRTRGGSSTRSCPPSTSPGSVFKMLTATAALGRRHRDDEDEDQGHRHARASTAARTHVDDADHKAHGRHEVRGRDRVLAQRRRREGRPELGKTTKASPQMLYRHVDAGWASGTPTGIDVANEVGGHRPRPGDDAVARRSTSRTARSGRASRSTPDPARAGVRARWSTAGRWSSRASCARSAGRETEPIVKGRVMTARALEAR